MARRAAAEEADQAFQAWCIEQQTPATTPDGNAPAGNAKPVDMQPPQGPADGLEAFLAAQAAARDKGKGKGKSPPWLANPWTAQAWGVPWTDTWGGPWPPTSDIQGKGKGMRYRDRTVDSRPPKKAYAERPPRDPRPCQLCGAPCECRFRTGTGHGYCTNDQCIRSQANKEARHGGARDRTPSRRKTDATTAAAASAPRTPAAAAPASSRS